MEKKEKNCLLTIKLCRETMNDVKDEDLVNIKHCLLGLCELIEKFQSDVYAKNLTSILEIIVFHITNDPTRSDLILGCLQNYDEMLSNIQESKIISDELKQLLTALRPSDKNKKLDVQKHSKFEQLNLFNPDGSRCTMEELMNS
jgi:hypothetical protein